MVHKCTCECGCEYKEYTLATEELLTCDRCNMLVCSACAYTIESRRGPKDAYDVICASCLSEVKDRKTVDPCGYDDDKMDLYREVHNDYLWYFHGGH